MTWTALRRWLVLVPSLFLVLIVVGVMASEDPLYSVYDRAAFFGDIETRTSDHGYFRCIPENTSALHRFGCLMHEHQRGHVALPFSDYAAHAFNRELSLSIWDLVREEYFKQNDYKPHDDPVFEWNSTTPHSKWKAALKVKGFDVGSDRKVVDSGKLLERVQSFGGLNRSNSIIDLERAFLSYKNFKSSRSEETKEDFLFSEVRTLPLLSTPNSWHLHSAWSASRMLLLASKIVHNDAGYKKSFGIQHSYRYKLAEEAYAAEKEEIRMRTGTVSLKDSLARRHSLTTWRSRRFNLDLDKFPSMQGSGHVKSVDTTVPENIKQSEDKLRYTKRAPTKKLLCLLLVPISPENDLEEFEQVVQRYKNTPKGALMEGGCYHLDITYGLSAPAPKHGSNPFYADECTHHVDTLLTQVYRDGGEKSVETELLSSLPGYEAGSYAAAVGNYIRHRCLHFDHVQEAHQGTANSRDKKSEKIRGIDYGTAAGASQIAIGSSWEGAIRALGDGGVLKPWDGFAVWFKDSHDHPKKGENLGPEFRERNINGLEPLNSLPFDYVVVIPHNVDFHSSSFTSHFAPSPRVIAGGTTLGAARYYSSEGLAMRVFEHQDSSSSSLLQNLMLEQRVAHSRADGHLLSTDADFEDATYSVNRLMVFNRHSQLMLMKILGSKTCRERLFEEEEAWGLDSSEIEAVAKPLFLTSRLLLDYIPLCIKRFSQRLTVPRLDDLSLEPITAVRFRNEQAPNSEGNFALIQDRDREGHSVLNDAVFST